MAATAVTTTASPRLPLPRASTTGTLTAGAEGTRTSAPDLTVSSPTPYRHGETGPQTGADAAASRPSSSWRAASAIQRRAVSGVTGAVTMAA